MDNLPKTEQDLLLLIESEAQESLTLEFKKSGALAKTDGKKGEISKDVSSFANSSGGIIIYGIEEDGHVAKSLDDGIDQNEISKEWLEQVINSTIQKKIDGVMINQISLKSKNGKAAYAIYIPQSARAPHQANDKRFYKRYNFQSVPMEEYEIQDIRNRHVTPSLKLDLVIHTDTVRFTKEDPYYSQPEPLYISVSNDSITPANYAVLQVYIDERILVPQRMGFEYIEDIPIEIDGQALFCKQLSQNWGIPANLPIWQGQSFKVDGPVELRFPSAVRGASYLIGYRVSSPGMPSKSAFKIINQGIRQISMTDYIDDLSELADKLGL